MLQPMHFRGSAWEGVSKEAREFVTYLCTYSPKQRPCAKEALRHVWLRRLHVCLVMLWLLPSTPTLR